MAARQDYSAEEQVADRPAIRTLTDPGMIRALSHPARLSIVEHLGATGVTATATELAEVVGLSPSATSYHLRAMAKAGLIEGAAGRGDARERRWQVVGGGWQVEGDPTADPERRAAEEALLATVLARANEKITQWFARAGDESPEWLEAVAISDATILVTAAELAGIAQAYRELLRPYLRRNRPVPPPGARAVTAHFRTVPWT
jgi:DNA-binding transcriptional ArsR family regulator